MKQIDISTKKYPNTFAIVDDDDYDYVSNLGKWHIDNSGYARIHKQKNKKIKRIKMHRYILEKKYGKYDEKQTDHINNNKLDNRKCNLRICSVSENLRNRLKWGNTKSIYKGVYALKRKNKQFFVSTILFNKKQNYIGFFKTEIEASRAYDKKAIELHGEFAKINGV